MSNQVFGEDGIYRSIRPWADLPKDEHLNLVQFLFDCTQQFAQKTALIDGISGEKTTFAELQLRIQKVASGLIKHGVLKGDVILILSSNCVEYPVVFLAAIFMGAIPTTVNPISTSFEISKQIKDSGAKFIFTLGELLNKVENLGLPLFLFDGDGKQSNASFVAFSKLLTADPLRVPAMTLQNDTAALLYSSGTTGLSKGVMLSHMNFVSTGRLLAVHSKLGGRENEILMCLLPMFHVYGLAGLLYGTLQRGSTVVSMPKFDFEQMLWAVEKYKVTFLPLVPPIVIGMVKHPIVGKYDLSSVDTVLSGAAPLGKETMDEFTARFPSIRIIQGYGLTESTAVAFIDDIGSGHQFSGSAGTLMSNIEAKVIDVESGAPLPPGKQGELWLRGPNIMKGYLNNPEATALTLDREGWLHTGDLVYMNQEGHIYIVDRIKELIKYKGFQVAPAELEALLLSHTSVVDAAVVPLPDDEAGQVPIAYVVRKSGSTVTETELLNFISRQVSPYKRLRKVMFISSVPRSASGKILRRELTDRALSKL